MSFIKKFVIVLVAVMLTSFANAVVIDFEEIDLVDSYNYMTSYSEEGYQFGNTISGASAFCSPGEGTYKYTGSKSLASCLGNSTIILSKEDGGLFDLLSIDLAEWTGTATRTVGFTGVFEDGSTIFESFTLDAVKGMETFLFDSFNNVASVRWNQTGLYHQFDNLILSESGVLSVSEPATFFLFMLGLSGLVINRKRAA